MYVILTSKPGQFHTEVGAAFRPVEAFDYVFYGRVRARFLIAELDGETRVRLIDENEPITVNDVPSKFLQKFQNIEGARRELQNLCAFGDMDTTLAPCDVASFSLQTPVAA
ncbi:ferredoxin [Hydrogenophaga sp.]|uniref:ferredoxin n=1 Tax=Hydrogenophaga sp. TaxID=1904254 RepID=UPI003F6D5256